MALGFNQTQGGAQKSAIRQYQMKNGDNNIRLVGGILPRYVYWIEGSNKKNIPFECLSFDRNSEKFNNVEKDWVRDYYPDMKCGWAYAMQCIDLDAEEPEVLVFNLKRKLFDQIRIAAEDLGDPTDPDNGWDVKFKKVKTGPSNFNIEYQLQVLKCKNRPLTDEEKQLVSEAKAIDEVLVRPTPDAQHALLEQIFKASSQDTVDDKEALDEEFDIR